MIRFETTVVRVAPAKEESGNGGLNRWRKRRKLVVMRSTLLLLFVMDITLNLVSLRFLVLLELPMDPNDRVKDRPISVFESCLAKFQRERARKQALARNAARACNAASANGDLNHDNETGSS